MTDAEAEELARAFLSEQIVLECTEPSVDLALYDFNASKETLFRFKLLGRASIGSSEYIVVSKVTGEVRYIGFCGE